MVIKEIDLKILQERLHMFLTKKYSITEYIKYAGIKNILKDSLLSKETLFVLSYFTIYMMYSFLYKEPDYFHWITLVIIPFSILYFIQSKSLISPSFRLSMAFFGLRKNNLSKGVLTAVLLGLFISIVKSVLRGNVGIFIDTLNSGEILFLLPIAFVIILVTVGFTEEFFFRGVIQTRLIRLVKSNIVGIILTSLLYGIFRIPYYYFTISVSGFSSWDPYLLIMISEGFFAGILLGYTYLKSNENLLSCVVLHSTMQILPMMAIIKLNWF